MIFLLRPAASGFRAFGFVELSIKRSQMATIPGGPYPSKDPSNRFEGSSGLIIKSEGRAGPRFGESLGCKLEINPSAMARLGK
jgi:hypothetical protein